MCYWLEGEVKSLVGLVFLFLCGGAVQFFVVFCVYVCGSGYSLGDECKCFGFDCGNYTV